MITSVVNCLAPAIKICHSATSRQLKQILIWNEDWRGSDLWLWNEAKQSAEARHWTIYNILSLSPPLVSWAHSPMLTLLPVQRADSVMCIPETPLPHHFPQGRERVEERMLSWLYKAERTPNEYIYMPIKIMRCSCGRLACFQGVLAQPDRESGEDTSATFEIWWDVKLYSY